MLPLAFKFDGVPVLVVGAGRVGVRKAEQLIDAGASVSMIAETFIEPAPHGVAHVEERRYQRGDLRGYHLVVSATGDATVNDEIVEEARSERIWLNVVDDPERCSFYFMALHRQGEVTIAVTTEGAAPALAQEIRTLAAQRLPDNLGDVAATLREERRAVHEQGASTEDVDWRARIRELLGVDAPRDDEATNRLDA
ncbi:MAG TPA: bifunctional precorrin-2 dehydrogenase/sirohydrochlorin ferrochelatase [Acidimicrobiales bacterium]|jgi:precorrin-2 dehydrogenase/sirohydrochlorin ferrochelatase|nr:bifunctional precorrin-2 dehydrogenase/sirohydrochlorin ferrochelatase [Acidimicrobiales bacterium]